MPDLTLGHILLAQYIILRQLSGNQVIPSARWDECEGIINHRHIKERMNTLGENHV
jgi:hypothetical protein